MLKARALSELPGVHHAFFTREGGVSNGIYASLNGGVGSNDRPQSVAENRTRMSAALSVAPGQLITAYQIHSPDVVVAEKSWSESERPRADGIVTRVPGLAIGISTADCGPVLFADSEARIIGAAHAGWRGALTGVLEATLVAMEKLGAKRTRIVAALGPMIRQPNYEVGTDLVDRFLAADRDNMQFFTPAGRAGHSQFDLPGYIAARLKARGRAKWRTLGIAPMPDPRASSPYRRATVVPSRTTAGMSIPSRSPQLNLF